MMQDWMRDFMKDFVNRYGYHAILKDGIYRWNEFDSSTSTCTESNFDPDTLTMADIRKAMQLVDDLGKDIPKGIVVTVRCPVGDSLKCYPENDDDFYFLVGKGDWKYLETKIKRETVSEPTIWQTHFPSIGGVPVYEDEEMAKEILDKSVKRFSEKLRYDIAKQWYESVIKNRTDWSVEL